MKTPDPNKVILEYKGVTVFYTIDELRQRARASCIRDGKHPDKLDDKQKANWFAYIPPTLATMLAERGIMATAWWDEARQNYMVKMTGTQTPPLKQAVISSGPYHVREIAYDEALDGPAGISKDAGRWFVCAGDPDPDSDDYDEVAGSYKTKEEAEAMQKSIEENDMLRGWTFE